LPFFPPSASGKKIGRKSAASSVQDTRRPLSLSLFLLSLDLSLSVKKVTLSLSLSFSLSLSLIPRAHVFLLSDRSSPGKDSKSNPLSLSLVISLSFSLFRLLATTKKNKVPEKQRETEIERKNATGRGTTRNGDAEREKRERAHKTLFLLVENSLKILTKREEK